MKKNTIYVRIRIRNSADSLFKISQPIFVAKFIVPVWGDKVDSGIGLSYRPARLDKLCSKVVKKLVDMHTEEYY
jgi:hypothetical protein